MLSDKCEACSAVFSDVDRTSPKIRHSHHVIPRAYGGTNGPQVQLCNEDHALIHAVGLAKIHNKPCDLSNLNPTHARNVEIYAQYIYIAFMRTENDPNKATKVALDLTGSDARKLDALKPVMGVTSRQRVIRDLIRAAHSLYFPLQHVKP